MSGAADGPAPDVPAQATAPATVDNPAPHVLVVTGCYDIGEQVDEREYTIECPGVTDRCRLWISCEQAIAQAADPLDDLHDSDTLWANDGWAHGVQHRYIDDEWMVPTDRCCFVDPLTTDCLPDVASELRAPRGHGRGLDEGRYPVRPEWLGEGWFALDLIGAEDTRR